MSGLKKLKQIILKNGNNIKVDTILESNFTLDFSTDTGFPHQNFQLFLTT
jgi:hypothetical protein